MSRGDSDRVHSDSVASAKADGAPIAVPISVPINAAPINRDSGVTGAMPTDQAGRLAAREVTASSESVDATVDAARGAVLVNGDAAAREAGVRALRAAGIAVIGASSVSKAREHVALDGASLVLVDRTVPGAPAMDLLDELKRSGKGPTRPVQALTALLAVDAPASQGNGRSVAEAPTAGVARRTGIGYPEPPQASASPGASASLVPSMMEMPLREARAQFEKMYLDELLQRFRGNVSEVARRAGLARTFLHAKLQKLDLEPGTYRRRKRRR